MKKLPRILLTLAACSAALCVAAAAEEAVPASAPAEEPAKAPAFVRVWGQVSPWDGEGIFLKNDDPDDPMNEVVLQTGGETYAVDAATGLPLDLKSVREGDTLYAWAGPAMTLSLPPQAVPIVLVGNVPAGASVPEYYELTSGGWKDPAGGDEIVFSYRDADGNPQDLPIPLDAEVTPWLTRQIIRLEGIEAGSQILVWRDESGAAEKVLVFPYAYRGVGSWNTAGTGIVNGEMVSVPGKAVKNEETGETQIYLPLRAMAEAAGYSVSWDKNRGAVVYDENVDLVFFAVPGEEVIFRDGGERGISGPCVLENGVTYLPAEDLCYWLNLYYFAD